MADLRTFVADAYKDKKPEIEPLPEIQPYREHRYSATDLPDPFSEANIQPSTALNKSLLGNFNVDPNRRKEPLEAFPLDALRMVGTMTQENQPWVVIKSTEGTVHRATLGNYMGQNNGKIKEILPEEQKVLLTEVVQDSSGRWVEKDVDLTIDE
jgi:type IV pilus assembly protein PilP